MDADPHFPRRQVAARHPWRLFMVAPAQEHSAVQSVSDLTSANESPTAAGAQVQSRVVTASRKFWAGKLWIAVAVLVILVALAIASYVLRAPVQPVKTLLIETGTLSTTVVATGTVVSQIEADISAQTAGEVRSTAALAGTSVKRNQPLVRLDDRQALAAVRKAEAALAQARAETDKAARESEASRRLLAFGGVAPIDVANAESQLDSAQAKMRAQEQELGLARQELAKMTIRAPFDGVVTVLNVRVGEWTTPSKPVLKVADLRKREVEARVDASDAGAILVGQPATVSSDTFPGKIWQGKVRQISPEIQKSDGGNRLAVRVELPQDEIQMLMGQQVDVKIETAVRERALKAPFNAVIEKDGKSWVAVIDDGRVRLLPVHTGIADLTSIEILDGIGAGQRVIAQEGKPIREGASVRDMSAVQQKAPGK